MGWQGRSGRGWHPLDGAAAWAFLVYAASATVTPICLVALAEEMKFGLAAAGGLEVVRSMLVVAVLLGSGVVAARFGKVRSLAVSCWVLGLGLGLYAAAPSYGWLAGALLVMGAGAGVVEGLVNPLVQEVHPRDSGKYLSFVNAFWSLGILLTMWGGGEWLAAGLSWRWLVGGLAGMSVMAGWWFWALTSRFPGDGGRPAGSALVEKVRVVRAPGFWMFCGMLVLAGAAEGALTFWSAALIQIKFETGPREGGWGAAAFALGMLMGRLVGARWLSQRRLYGALLISGWVGLGATLALPWVPSFAGLVGILWLAGFAVAPFWPGLQSYAVDRLGLEPTALFILLSCGAIPGFAAATALIGWVGEVAGLGMGLLVVPGSLGVLLVLLGWERRVNWGLEQGLD